MTAEALENDIILSSGCKMEIPIMPGGKLKILKVVGVSLAKQDTEFYSKIISSIDLFCGKIIKT